jgi:transcriptional regulator with XRE-family HTH domain
MVDKNKVSNFGSRVRVLRQERGMSVGDLAKAVRVTRAAVWHWEKRGRLPRSSTREDLAHALGVDTGYLEGRQPLVPSIVPEHPTREAQDFSLEELIKAIEAKGFLVRISSKG